MARRIALAILATLLPMLGGCGTVHSIFMKPESMWRVYGGVSYDMELVCDAGSAVGLIERPGKEMSTEARIHAVIVAVVAVTVDLPFSVVADTLLLPTTIRASRERSSQVQSGKEAPDPDSNSAGRQ